MATKPIPGALVVPVGVVVAFLRLWSERKGVLGGRTPIARSLAMMRAFASDRRVYAAAGVTVGAFVIGFPFAILNFNAFLLQQIGRIQADTAEVYPPGASLIHYIPQAGWFLCVLGVFALVYQSWRGSAAGRILAPRAAPRFVDVRG